MFQISLTVPNSCPVFCAEPTPGKPSIPFAQMLTAVLDAPTGCPPIEKTVTPNQKVCLILDDNTRYTPVTPILQQLLPRLLGAGIRKEDIFMVFALGSHRKMTQEEMQQKVGAEIFSSYRMYNSEFSDPEQLIVIGKTEFGTEITVTSRVMEADIRIGIGSIVPHTCFGWSGGAKILFPGVTGENIVSEFHAMGGLTADFLFGKDDCVTRAMIEGWAAQIGLDFIVNCILTPDGDPYGVCAGHYVTAHRQGCQIARKVFGIPVPFQPDITVVNSYPLRQDFWQCTKALESAAIVTREGGQILLLAPCVEGLGPHPDVIEHINRTDGKAEVTRLLKTHQYGEKLLSMAVGTSIRKTTDRFRVSLFCDHLDKPSWDCPSIALYPEAALPAQLNALIQEYFRQNKTYPKVLFIPSGGDSLPYLP